MRGGETTLYRKLNLRGVHSTVWSIYVLYFDLRIPEKREHILVLLYRRGNRFWLELALVAARQHGAFVLPVGLERARMHA